MNNSDKIKQAAHFLEMHYDVVFPNGFSRVSNNFMGGENAFFTFGLIDNQQDCSSNIRDNDIGFGKFSLRIENDMLVLERSFHALTCLPTDKYCALSHQKVSYRKIKAKNYDELVTKFDKYLTKFVSLVNEKKAANEIYNQKNYDERYFEFNEL